MLKQNGLPVMRYQAAGGIVFEGDQVLLLRKNKKGEIVLPKGHIESGETPVQAAVRETQEEAGYANLEVLFDLGAQEAQFPFKGQWVIRDENYFVMRLIDREETAMSHADAAYDQRTFEVRWVALDEAETLLTFAITKGFMRRAIQWWRENRK
jgi:8-oxo-dGTP pyrophosphatase MutT (NUDIX family)